MNTVLQSPSWGTVRCRNLIVAVCALLPMVLTAQEKSDLTEVVTDHVRIRYDSRIEMAKDRSMVLTVEIAPRPRMHVYAPGKHDYRVIAITLSQPKGIELQPIVYPPSETYHFEPLDERIPVYQKPFALKVESKPGSAIARPPLTISGHLDYQACDDRVCFAPVSVPLSWTVTR